MLGRRARGRPAPSLSRRAMTMPPVATPGYSPALDRALTVAGIVHAQQKRKGTAVPYLTHPVQVAMILARHGFPERLLIAAVLHDVLEDVTPDDPMLQRDLRETFPAAFRDAPEDREGFLAAVERFLADAFHGDVMALVRGLTDEKHRADGSRLPWHEAKRLSHDRLASEATPAEVVVVKCADALHNARQVTNDLQSQGLSMMRRFNAGPEDTLRHYATVWQIARARLGADVPLVVELGAAVTDLARTLAAQFKAAHECVDRVAREVAGDPGALA